MFTLVLFLAGLITFREALANLQNSQHKTKTSWSLSAKLQVSEWSLEDVVVVNEFVEKICYCINITTVSFSLHYRSHNLTLA